MWDGTAEANDHLAIAGLPQTPMRRSVKRAQDPWDPKKATPKAQRRHLEAEVVAAAAAVGFGLSAAVGDELQPVQKPTLASTKLRQHLLCPPQRSNMK